jgi:hypothetical protein
MGLEKEKARETNSFPKILHQLIEVIPFSSQHSSHEPLAKARKLGSLAAMKAAAFSGALAMPPGPLGLLTIIPDLLGIWRIQAQLAADVAAVYGKTGYLTRESMLYCMFRHGAAHAVRDVVIRSGQRLLIRRITLQATDTVLRKVGIRLSERLATRAVTRWLPIIGAVGVGAYAYYDTGEVAKTAIQTFSSDLNFDEKTPQP